MQGGPIPQAPAEDVRAARAILSLLLQPHDQRPWSVDEIELAIGDRLATIDALAELHATGLIHRWDRFVVASRPAIHMAALWA
jgi:hypothetical protein